MAMTFEKIETSVLEIKDRITEEFSWDFKIPPKSRIRENVSEIAEGSGFVFSDLKFNTGFLANIQHELIFAIYMNQVNIYLLLPTKCRHVKYDIKRPGKLELLSENLVKSSKELRFHTDDMSAAPTPHNLFATIWMNTDNSWDDSIDLMRVTLSVDCETLGVITSYANEDITKKIKAQPPPLELNATELFLSNDLCDMTFVCGGQDFPAHRFLLACKSPVFKQMFQHEMKENKEKQIFISDIEPEVLKELLRFLYCGHSNNINELCSELFIAAEKYQLDVLKTQCEIILWRNITAENALAMYMLADTHNGALLKEKAVKMMKKYKSETVPDKETFKEFTRRYPDLMFALFV